MRDSTAQRLGIVAVCAAATLVPGLASVSGQQPEGAIEILQVQPTAYMLAGAGGNIGAQVGHAGIVVVDTGAAAASDQVIAALRRISDKPVRYIINTSSDDDHVGGNAAVAKAGSSIISDVVGNALSLSLMSNNGAASILAHDNVLSRLSNRDSALWPTKTYTANHYKMSLNGDGIEVVHQPSAHSDGDSVVVFRRANVIVTGDVFDPTRFPVIDRKRGGTIQGTLRSLNWLLEMTIPPYPQPWLPERTYLIPGHGPISDSPDLLEYRDMVTIVHDVIQDLIGQGKTLEQVRAANPTLGYNARYGRSGGADAFVTAIYEDLTARPGR